MGSSFPQCGCMLCGVERTKICCLFNRTNNAIVLLSLCVLLKPCTFYIDQFVSFGYFLLQNQGFLVQPWEWKQTKIKYDMLWLNGWDCGLLNSLTYVETLGYIQTTHILLFFQNSVIDQALVKSKFLLQSVCELSDISVPIININIL